MFLAGIFAIAANWNPPRCPIAGDQINKLRYIHSIRYYTAIKNMNC